MDSYIERHLSFGVDEFEGLWRVQFLHPFFYGNEKQYVTVYVVPSNSDYTDSEYNGYEVVDMGENMNKVIDQLLPRIEKYPYRWELEGKKLDAFGYDLVCGLVKGSSLVNNIDFTDIAFEEINRYYTFTEPAPLPDIVIETEEVEGKGAMTKIGVTLEKAQWVNQLSFDFFSEYPVQVLSAMYQEDTMKYAPVYELDLGATTQSSSSLSFGFPSVFAKKFTFILCQSTYTISTTSKSTAEANKESLWDLVGGSVGNVLSSILADEQQWKEDLVSFTKQQLERKALSQGRVTNKQTEWRPAYATAKDSYDKKLADYEAQLEAYQEEQSKYKKEMEEYVRYQQDLASWYSKWGG